MEILGKIEKVKDLRTIWKHEALDFTKWLGKEENLELLSQAIEIEISLEALESAVGNFSVDIYATEETTGRKIIIENQLEDTDHDHLGKIITYASGKSAEVIVWIVKNTREEHKKAIEWLNNYTDENIGFFLVEIELWRIDNSAPAVKFNVVERPNNWAKKMKHQGNLTETKQLQLEYWQKFRDYAVADDNFKREFTTQTPRASNYYDLTIGTSKYRLALRVSSQKKILSVEIYIRDNKDIFEEFKKNAVEIENILGASVEWVEANIDCRILVKKDFDIKNKAVKWDNAFNWQCDMALKFKEVSKKYGV